MKYTLFSIIIPTYNRANEISRCLSSVVNQTYRHWEAIVVDNFSDDNTEEIVNNFKDERIRYYKNHNYGIISVSRNYALDRANGDWICFLDSDDSWKPNKLECLLPYIDKFDLIYHGYIEKGTNYSLINRKKILFYTVKQSCVSYVMQRSDPFSPSCTAVSKEFMKNTRFSEDKRLFAIEDYDFFLQLLQRHPRIKHLKKYLTYYDVSTGISHNEMVQLDRNRVIIEKFKDCLSRNEYRNVLKLYMYTRGLTYIDKDKKKARKFFAAGIASDVFFVKWRSFAGYCLSFF